MLARKNSPRSEILTRFRPLTYTPTLRDKNNKPHLKQVICILKNMSSSLLNDSKNGKRKDNVELVDPLRHTTSSVR